MPADSRSCRGCLAPLVKLCNRLLIDSGCSVVGFHLLIRLPDLPLGNTIRLCLTHRLLPLLVGSLNQAPQHHPFAPSLSGTSSLLRVVPPWAPLPYSRPHGASTWASPFASVLQVPTFRTTASDRLRPPSCRMPLRPSAGSAGADPAVTTPRGFDIVPTLSTRHQWFPCGPLPVGHLTWFSPGLFLLRSPPWLLTTAAGGGLEPAPASRFRGASPHRLHSYALRRPLFGPSSCSWRTVIGVSDVSQPSISRVIGVAVGILLHLPASLDGLRHLVSMASSDQPLVVSSVLPTSSSLLASCVFWNERIRDISVQLVEVDIGQDWAHHSTLWCSTQGGVILPIFTNTVDSFD